MPSKNTKKLVAVVGPTGSGKSGLAVELALIFNGEIISADSRQIYRGLNLSSGKITHSEMKSVPHHLLDVAGLTDPQPFTLANYLDLARRSLAAIYDRKRLPFVVGGTGLYVTALLEGYDVPEIPPNPALRGKLESLSLEKLQDIYSTLDPEGFNKVDISNPRRLMRAIEVVTATKKPFFSGVKKNKPEFKSLVLGIDVPWPELKEKIHNRLLKRYQAGMLEEVKILHEGGGVPWSRLENLGLEQKWMSKLAQMLEVRPQSTPRSEVESEVLLKLEKEEIALARRQLTWWRKKDVKWIKDCQEAKNVISTFLIS